MAGIDAEGDACSTKAPTEAEWDPWSSVGWSSSAGADSEDASEASPPGGIFDVVADEAGEMLLLPVGGGRVLRVSELREDAEVTIRVFRFIEDVRDEAVCAFAAGVNARPSILQPVGVVLGTSACTDRRASDAP